MMPSDAKFAELAELLARLCDGKMEEPQWEELESLLLGDPDAQDFYWRFLVVESDLEWHVASRCPSLPFGLDGQDGPAARTEAPAARLKQGAAGGFPPLGENHCRRHDRAVGTFGVPSSSLSCIICSPVAAYAMAVLFFGAAALAAWMWPACGEREAAMGPPRASALAPRDGGLQATVVGRIVGAKDCRWADPPTAATVGQTVAVGRKFALASGRLMIAYNIGDRVTLEGPVTYEVDSDHSGRLSAGNLTFRSVAMDFIGGALGKLSAKGHRTVPAFVKPQFYLRGPRVTVVDRIAEFTLSIEPSGISHTRLVQGDIELRYPHGVKPGDSISGRVWWTAEGDKTHFWRAVCHAGEIPPALRAEADNQRRSNGGTFVEAGGSAPRDRPPSKYGVSGENGKPEVGLP
jgi:hypothetical protein